MKAEKITPINESGEYQLQSGRIESAGETCRILSDGRHYAAIRAFSCLVEPCTGDSVLFSVDSRQQCHILAIIDRPQTSATRLVFPGDVTIDAADGQLNIHAARELNLVSQGGIRQAAHSFALAAKEAILNVDSTTAVGASLVSRIGQVQTFAERVEMVVGHWLQKLKNSFRQVDGVDRIRAGESMHDVDNLYSLRSRQSVMLAKKDIKMDAERIHMG